MLHELWTELDHHLYGLPGLVRQEQKWIRRSPDIRVCPRVAAVYFVSFPADLLAATNKRRQFVWKLVCCDQLAEHQAAKQHLGNDRHLCDAFFVPQHLAVHVCVRICARNPADSQGCSWLACSLHLHLVELCFLVHPNYPENLGFPHARTKKFRSVNFLSAVYYSVWVWRKQTRNLRQRAGAANYVQPTIRRDDLHHKVVNPRSDECVLLGSPP